MKMRIKILASFVLVFGLAGQVLATVITSGDLTESCVMFGGGACSVQTISVHNLWQPNDPNGNGAQWISYADTGVDGNNLAPTSSTNPVFTVTETFMAGVGDMLALDVWADDTAEVFINGTSVFSPNFTQNVCADGAIGCEPLENGMIDYTFLVAGIQTLSFDVFQVGTGTSNASNPFGLLYSGTTTSAAAPTSLMLMSIGLLGMRGFRRRNRLQ
jgi:hypothetical protein